MKSKSLLLILVLLLTITACTPQVEWYDVSFECFAADGSVMRSGYGQTKYLSAGVGTLTVFTIEDGVMVRNILPVQSCIFREVINGN